MSRIVGAHLPHIIEQCIGRLPAANISVFLDAPYGPNSVANTFTKFLTALAPNWNLGASSNVTWPACVMQGRVRLPYTPNAIGCALVSPLKQATTKPWSMPCHYTLLQLYSINAVRFACQPPIVVTSNPTTRWLFIEVLVRMHCVQGGKIGEEIMVPRPGPFCSCAEQGKFMGSDQQ